MNNPPPSPGSVLKESVIEKLNISVDTLAKKIHVPPNRIYLILQNKREITTDTALRLGHYLGTGPELWLHIQMQYDIYLQQSKFKSIQDTIEPYSS